jgi:1,4-dihydroxy-2-naphthoate octaprenyltransferase
VNQEIFSLRRDAPELRPVLIEGTILRHGESWAALPREVVANSNGTDSIVFELVRPECLIRPSFFKIWATAIRPLSLSMTFMPALSVLFYGLYREWDASFLMGILALIGVVFFQVAVHVLNDVEDHLRLIDLPGSLSGSGVLQKGWMSAKQLRQFGYLILICGVGLGLPAALSHPGTLFIIGGTGLFGVLGYSNRPFGIKYRVLGDSLLFVLLGPFLAIGFAEAAFGQFDFSILTLGLFFGFVAWAISHGNHLLHIDMDTCQSVPTWASRLGFKKARHIFAALYAVAYLCLFTGILFGSLPIWVGFASLVGIPVVGRLIRRVYRAAGPASALLGTLRGDTIKIHLLLGLLVCIGLLAAHL